MTLTIQALLAFAPILISAVLLVGLRWTPRTTMPLAYVVAVAVAWFFWQVSATHIAAATVQGLLPSIGALGAFIAGSNTVSNLMFSLFQYGVAERLLISGAMVVSLQAVGAAAGNMITIHNVVAASATVGLLGQEGATLRRTFLPTVYYVTAVGLLGLLAIYVPKIADPLLVH